MKTFYEKLKDQLVKHEGKEKYLYQCTAKKQTIGIGHNIEENGISDAVIDLIYQEDIQEVFGDLRVLFPSFDHLPERIKLVLGDMRFQLGYHRFRSFKKMIKAVHNRDWDEMIVEMKDSDWYRKVPNRPDNLIELILTEL